MNNTLTFSLPTCLLGEAAQTDFQNQITRTLANGEMPKLCLNIGTTTSTKDIYQAIQIISGINKFMDVSFQLRDDVNDVDNMPEQHPAWGYLKICQSWLPNAHVVM